MSRLAAPRETALNESEGSAERLTGSIRSSDGAGSASGYDDVATSERSRVEFKIEQIKERLARISLAREADVVDFLAMTNNLRGGQENPQIIRVRQHFEKKNKKYAQETEHLQKKLEQLEGKLIEIEKGPTSEPSAKSAVLSNIRKTGPLLREVTGSVISAPRGIAHIIKNKFGSADNIVDNFEDASNVGHSTFYSGSSSNDERNRAHSVKSEGAGLLPHRVGTLPAMSLGSPPSRHSKESLEEEPAVIDTNIEELRNELKEVKLQNQTLADQLNKIQTFLQTEFNYFNKALHDERLKVQRLEEILNESIELHQAEMTSLKSDLNTIGTRMDYQYCDRFRSIEESIEGTENRIIRLETNVKEWTETRPQSVLNAALLSGANILVELLKLILFIVSVALDFVKPLTGTRTRAGFFILFWLLFMLVSPYIDFSAIFSKLNLINVLRRNNGVNSES